MTYRDLNMRAESWRQVSQIVGVPGISTGGRGSGKRSGERAASGSLITGPGDTRPILSFLNPFIDARAAGTNAGLWTLSPPYISVGDATTTTTSSPSSEFVQRKRPSSDTGDDFSFKEAKMEGGAGENDCAQTQQQQHDNMKELFEMMMHSVSSLAASIASSHPSSSSSSSLDQPTLNHHLKTENQEAELLVLSDDEGEE
ncbi:hypothetical protein F7725_020053, partial [Dissostichus mawsoni]